LFRNDDLMVDGDLDLLVLNIHRNLVHELPTIIYRPLEQQVLQKHPTF